MSMENAILELAKSMALVAESNHVLAAAYTGSVESMAKEWAETPTSVAGQLVEGQAKRMFAKDDELEQAVEKVEAAAKVESAGRKAINEALAKAKEQAAAKVEKTDEPAAALDYKADVYPKLVALAKAKGKPALVGLLKEFDAANGDALKAEQYSAVVARAAELAA